MTMTISGWIWKKRSSIIQSQMQLIRRKMRNCSNNEPKCFTCTVLWRLLQQSRHWAELLDCCCLPEAQRWSSTNTWSRRLSTHRCDFSTPISSATFWIGFLKIWQLWMTRYRSLFTTFLEWVKMTNQAVEEKFKKRKIIYSESSLNRYTQLLKWTKFEAMNRKLGWRWKN